MMGVAQLCSVKAAGTKCNTSTTVSSCAGDICWGVTDDRHFLCAKLCELYVLCPLNGNRNKIGAQVGVIAIGPESKIDVDAGGT